MIPISECRQYLPPDWSDDQIREYRDDLYQFIVGMMTILENNEK